MNTTMADGAAQRLVAQIAADLFGQPGLTLMELAEKVKEARNNDVPLGYVRVEAIKALREDDEVTGVMVYVEERADSVPVYLAARQPVELIAKKVGDYRVTVAEDAITVSHGRDIVFAYSAGDPEPINACQPVEAEENVAADTYWTVAEMIEPHIQDGALPASVHDSVSILLEHWLKTRQPVGQEPVGGGGFVISNGSGEKYMAWGQVGPEWTADRSAALWLVRRVDAEALAAENEDAWSILPVERCALPPNGWACTLAAGHEGPCPTIAAPTAQAVDLAENMLSVLIEEGVLGRNGRVFQKLRGLIDSQAVGNG